MYIFRQSINQIKQIEYFSMFSMVFNIELGKMEMKVIWKKSKKLKKQKNKIKRRKKREKP